MFCSNCGKEIPDASVFCPECGAKITLPEPRFDEAAKNDGVTAGYYSATQPENTGYYAPNQESPSDPGFYTSGPTYYDPQMPAADIVHKHIGSGAFLIMTICLTAGFLISLIQLLSYYDVFRYALYDGAERAVFIMTMMFSFIMMMLLIVGCWMMWGTARSRSGIKGATMVQVWSIILAALIGIVLIGSLLYFFFEVRRSYAWQINEIMKAGLSDFLKEYHLQKDFYLAVGAMVLSFVLVVLYLIYFCKIAVAASRIREMSWTGVCRKKIPGFISFMNVINILFILIAIFFVLFAAEELRGELPMEFYYYGGGSSDGIFMLAVFSMLLDIVALICLIVVNSGINRDIRYMHLSEYQEPLPR